MSTANPRRRNQHFMGYVYMIGATLLSLVGPLFILALPDTITSGSLRFEHLVQIGRLVGALTISPVQLIAMSWIKKTESYERTFDSPHIYSDLEKNELRILILEAGPPGSEISCRLLVCRHEDRLPYDALSYAWGDPTNVMLITCNDQSLRIPANLYVALQFLRHRTDDRILWVDALCINQKNKTERGHQVEKMSRIFSEANRTLVWLGNPGGRACSEAFNLLKTYNFEIMARGTFTHSGNLETSGLDFSRSRKESLLTKDWRPLVPILELPWFRRLWVIQEVVCAKRIVVLGGHERTSWDSLAKAVVELSRSGLLEGSLTEKGVRGARAVVDMDEIRNTTRQGNPPDLLSLLLQTSAAESLDIRDKVYGVLSLAGDYDPIRDGTFLKPDYFIPPQELYTKVARWCLEKANLDIVLSCATTSEQSDWPSWVPDWGNIDNSFPFSRYLDNPRHEIPWNATNVGRPCGLSTSDRVPPMVVEGNKLVLHGICVDHISELSPPFRLHHTGRPRTLEAHSSASKDNLNWLAECFEMASRTARQIEGEHERWRVSYDVKRRLGIIMTASLTGDGCIVSDLYTKWFDDYVSWLKTDYQQWIKNCQEHPERFPDIDWKWHAEDDGKAYILPENLYNESVAAIESSISMWASRRRFGITQTGRMVLVPQHTVEGDLIVLVQGCRLPYVFRSCGGDQEGMYRVVGEAFVEDMMNGDFFKFISQESKTEKTQEERIFQEFLVG
ncbi:hypothetical protein G7054_g9835 [Neopestalotiopsis clavispora]|nr:hypothetical protein G7054_g9835 [Neopestalotiopsis clavispora]